MVAVVGGVLSALSNVDIFIHIGKGIADIFVAIFKALSLPLIALSLITTLSKDISRAFMKTVGLRSFLYTLSTTFVAACVACIFYYWVSPGNIIATPTHSKAALDMSAPSYIKHLSTLIPNNFFTPFIDHHVIGVLIIGIVVGFAIRSIKDSASKEVVTRYFKGLHDMMLVITGWVVKILPVGIYGFIVESFTHLQKHSEFKGLGLYLLVIVGANLLQGFIILPIWLKLNGIKPFWSMNRVMPALSVAFFSKSSSGTLPLTMEKVENNLHVNPSISRFVLPLCTTINMNGCAAFIVVTAIYIMQNYGIQLSFFTVLLWIVISTIAAVGNAGVPMGCFFLTTSLVAGMGIPPTLMGIILPFYGLIDMVETALNVWSDTCVTTVVSKKYSNIIHHNDIM